MWKFTLEEEAIVSKLAKNKIRLKKTKNCFIALPDTGAQRGQGTRRDRTVCFSPTLSFSVGDILFFLFYPVSLFLIPFFVGCFLMPVVSTAYETDVIRHSWSCAETMRKRRENLTLVLQPAPSLPSVLHKANPPIIHIHPVRQKFTHNAVHYGPPDMWKRGKQR